jgi:hypothetical protein
MTTATYTFDEHTVSDLHKDAYGFRPCQNWWADWESMNDEGKQQEWNSLLEAMDHREAQRASDEQNSIARFESLVAKTVKAGAATRADAVRWLMDGEDHVSGDVEFFEYLMGIPYGYVNSNQRG